MKTIRIIDEERSATNIALSIIRWIGFLPLAVLALFLAEPIVRIVIALGLWIANITMPAVPLSDGITIDPMSWWSRVLTELLSGGISGITSVFLGTTVAPSRKKTICVVLTILVCLWSIRGVLLNLSISDYWGILFSVCEAVGSLVIMSMILRGEIVDI